MRVSEHPLGAKFAEIPFRNCLEIRNESRIGPSRAARRGLLNSSSPPIDANNAPSRGHPAIFQTVSPRTPVYREREGLESRRRGTRPYPARCFSGRTIKTGQWAWRTTIRPACPLTPQLLGQVMMDRGVLPEVALPPLSDLRSCLEDLLGFCLSAPPALPRLSSLILLTEPDEPDESRVSSIS